MIAPDQQTINTLAWIVLAIMGVFQQVRTARGHSITHKQQEALKVEQADIKADTSLIKKSVNGPLGIALMSAATALEALARRTKDPDDILRAVAARSASDDHIKMYEKSMEALRKTEEEKNEIISTFIRKINEQAPLA